MTKAQKKILNPDETNDMFLGTVKASYKEMVAAFGKPEKGDGYKPIDRRSSWTCSKPNRRCPPTFSKKQSGALMSWTMRAMCGQRWRGSLSPSFLPATLKGWHG
jgi:hypothetical protein